MPDQVASLLPSGAGRFQDFIWPDPLQWGGPGIGAAHRSRTAGGAEATGTQVLFGAGTAGFPQVIIEQPFVQIPSGAANSGIQYIMYPGFPVTLRTSRTPIDGTTDDCAVWRFLIVMSAERNVAGGGEQGFQITQWNNGAGCRLIGDNAPGFALDLPDQTNDIWFRANGPNGLQSINLGTPGQASSFLSTFDLRVFSATATADAFLTLRCNGVVAAIPAIFSNWGAVGTNLPPVGSVAGSVGFVPSLVSSSQAANGVLAVQSLEMMCAPTELNTL